MVAIAGRRKQSNNTLYLILFGLIGAIFAIRYLVSGGNEQTIDEDILDISGTDISGSYDSMLSGEYGSGDDIYGDDDNRLIDDLNSGDIDTGITPTTGSTTGTQTGTTVVVVEEPTTTPTPTPTPEPTRVSSSPSLVNTGGIVFNSTRGGYAINFPSKGIAYQGINVNENLGLNSTSCYVNIQVKKYSERDANVSAWVEIYECSTKLSVDAIQSQRPNDIVTTSADGSKVFIIQAKDPSRSSFAQGVSITQVSAPSTSSTGSDVIVVQ